MCFGEVSVWLHFDQPLRCGAAVASWEPSPCSRWAFDPLKVALGLWPRPTIDKQRFADPASGSACGSVVFNGGFIVIKGVLRQPPMGPVARQCPVKSHLPAVIISASSVFPGPWRCPCPIYASPLHDYFTIFFCHVFERILRIGPISTEASVPPPPPTGSRSCGARG